MVIDQLRADGEAQRLLPPNSARYAPMVVSFPKQWLRRLPSAKRRSG